jgi:hypothetical protein
LVIYNAEKELISPATASRGISLLISINFDWGAVPAVAGFKYNF